MTWMLYGAYGYTGQLVAAQAIHRGQRPILAGRNAARLAEVATPLGLPYRTFDLREPRAVDTALRGVDVLAHCAGPFSATSAPVIDGCLRQGTHYLDITGEIDVLEAAFERDAEARRAGILLLPGAGFDVVPTDCLAATVAARLPGATRLDVAIQTGGGVSRRTWQSALEGAVLGGRARIDGRITEVPIGWRSREVPFPSVRRRVVSLPRGDVSTAYHSTGIGNVTAYAYLPGLGRIRPRRAARGRSMPRPAVAAWGKAAIGTLARGPGRRRRARGWVEVFAETFDDSGRSVSAALIGPDTYDFTADSVLRIVSRVESGRVKAGTHSPSSAFGADLIRSMHGIKVIEPGRR